MASRSSRENYNRKQAERKEAAAREARDEGIARLTSQTQGLQSQIDAQAGARAALERNLRNEANARFTEYDKSLREYESDWTAFEDRQTRIVERKTEADAARDAKWKGVKEAAAWNPLTEHLDTEGKLNLKGYQALKDAGWTSLNISDYTKVGAYTDGITMGDKALEQYNIDTAQADPTWKDIKQTPLTDINEQIKKPLASLGAGHTYSSVVSKGGNISGGEGLRISPRKTDINALKRENWPSFGSSYPEPGLVYPTVDTSVGTRGGSEGTTPPVEYTIPTAPKRPGRRPPQGPPGALRRPGIGDHWPSFGGRKNWPSFGFSSPEPGLVGLHGLNPGSTPGKVSNSSSVNV